MLFPASTVGRVVVVVAAVAAACRVVLVLVSVLDLELVPVADS